MNKLLGILIFILGASSGWWLPLLGVPLGPALFLSIVIGALGGWFFVQLFTKD